MTEKHAVQAHLSAIARAARRLAEDVRGGAGKVERYYGFHPSDALEHPAESGERRAWGFWPGARAGLFLRHMTARQKAVSLEIMSLLLSEVGYLRAGHVMLLEDLLGQQERGIDLRSSDEYAVALFGEPGSADWGLRFEGHHLSVNLTVRNGEVCLLPYFIGANPASRTAGPLAGFAPLRAVTAAAFALRDHVGAAAEVAGPVPGDFLSSPLADPDREAWRRDLPGGGLAVAELDGQGAVLFEQLLQTILGDLSPVIAAGAVARARADELSIAWSGSDVAGAPHYFRITGADGFVYEHCNVQDGGNHIHSIWRDRRREP